SMSVFRVSSVVWVLLSFPTRRSSDMVSWKNVKADQGDLTWDDYLETGVIQAMRVVREISGQARINVLGFCVGGTLVGTAAAVLAARGDQWIESMTRSEERRVGREGR